ncbi:MAG: exodeoxyribonuclease VII large subunit [Bryobacteraceae bacterium]
MEQISLSWERKVFTVNELNLAVGGLLTREFRDILVAGEISGCKAAPSGHIYFALKDQVAQLRCVCFRLSARLLRFKPRDGLAVVARGRLEVYAPRGEYQFVVETLEPQGLGALQLAFEQLKKKLEAEGLFAAGRKRPLPRMPHRIGIVTSLSGAAIRDMVEILSRRFPGIWIRLYPALVQGAGSIEAVVDGIDSFSRTGWADVVIVGRGGGSLEDLWTFNEEAVARAIARSRVPVVSAVGHETDFTISDFVADLRAPTPSAAAEMVVPERARLLEQVYEARRKLAQALRYRLAGPAARLLEQHAGRAATAIQRMIRRGQQRVDDLGFRLRKHDVRMALAAAHRRVAASEARLAALGPRRLALANARLESLSAQLAHLSPLAVLDRGYAIVLDSEGRALRDAAVARLDQELDIRLRRGRLAARVTDVTP